ncbi:MAG: hypothetical protein K6G88_14840 [Lachnospiraceae bacterium]|nr:hypothetical protein [Lachnospiraceae bacterium]
MRQRVINYLNYLDEVTSSPMSEEEKESFISNFLIQLDFYQRERLIHLIVTITFALISVISLVANFFIFNVFFFIFILGSLILLGFYVRHYFFLERSVQKMYTYFDRLKEPKIFTDTIIEPFKK